MYAFICLLVLPLVLAQQDEMPPLTEYGCTGSLTGDEYNTQDSYEHYFFGRGYSIVFGAGWSLGDVYMTLCQSMGVYDQISEAVNDDIKTKACETNAQYPSLQTSFEVNHLPLLLAKLEGHLLQASSATPKSLDIYFAMAALDVAADLDPTLAEICPTLNAESDFITLNTIKLEVLSSAATNDSAAFEVIESAVLESCTDGDVDIEEMAPPLIDSKDEFIGSGMLSILEVVPAFAYKVLEGQANLGDATKEVIEAEFGNKASLNEDSTGNVDLNATDYEQVFRDGILSYYNKISSVVDCVYIPTTTTTTTTTPKPKPTDAAGSEDTDAQNDAVESNGNSTETDGSNHGMTAAASPVFVITAAMAIKFLIDVMA